MREALQELVVSQSYTRHDFTNDNVKDRISGYDLWELIDRITKAAGPVLLLLRLGDSNQATLSKLKGTVEYIKTLMVNTGEDTLEDQIAEAFHNRAEELECDVSSAAYLIDPLFVAKSRHAGIAVMSAFFRVARSVLCPKGDDTVWRTLRQQLVTQLANFRMKTGGFAMEDYTLIDTCVFWGTAGCYAPLLRQLAFALAALPCSSGEAERNWNEVKQNLVKNRNRLGRERLEKMVFVRRFIRLQRAIAFDDNSSVAFSKWVKKLLEDATKTDDDDVVEPGGNDPDDIEQRLTFEDSIEPGEQGRINGREPGQPRVRLTALRRDNAAKSWLFEKYYNMHFVDKNPDGGADDPPLEDESEWEHRVIKNVVWYRAKGYAVLTSLRGDPDDPLVERYEINSKLHEMIRDSPHNNRTMRSSMNQEPAAAEAAEAAAPDEEDSHSDTSSDAGENRVNVRHV